MKNPDVRPQAEEVRVQPSPEYEPPRVITHRGQEILEELGPAQACTFNHAIIVCP